MFFLPSSFYFILFFSFFLHFFHSIRFLPRSNRLLFTAEGRLFVGRYRGEKGKRKGGKKELYARIPVDRLWIGMEESVEWKTENILEKVSSVLIPGRRESGANGIGVSQGLINLDRQIKSGRNWRSGERSGNWTDRFPRNRGIGARTNRPQIAALRTQSSANASFRCATDCPRDRYPLDRVSN